MGRAWWGAAGASWWCQQEVLPVYNCTREKSRTCLPEDEPWPVIEPGVWVLDGEAEHLLCGSSDYSFLSE